MPYAQTHATEQKNITCSQTAGYPSLAIVYSPYQSFDNLFTPSEALCKGTIFAELDKSFYGTCDGNGMKWGMSR